MLPFLKNRDDGVGVGTVETKAREHDEDFEPLSAVAGDMLAAMKAGDQKLLQAALEALCEYVREEDVKQDKEMT